MQSALSRIYNSIREKIDLPFLIFLLTISSNKIYLKVVALALIFILRPRFDFFFNRKISLFYPAILILATFHFLFLERDFRMEHIALFLVGAFYWMACYGYMYQSYLFVKGNGRAKIDATIILYVSINFAACIFNYISVCIKAQSAFPFLQEGIYGTSAGDYIWGLFGSPSYINAIICSFFAIYFLYTKRYGMFLLTSFFVLLPFANIISIVFAGALVLYLFFPGEWMRRVYILLGLVMWILMYYFISPNNFDYIAKTFKLSFTKNEEIMPQVSVSESKGAPQKAAPRVKYVNDSSATKQKVVVNNRHALFKDDYSGFDKYYPINLKTSAGKKIAVMQTIKFLEANPKALVFGAGMGNFSSRLAFQFSGRDSSRIFRRLPNYCSGYYYANHLLIFDAMSGLPGEYHSIKHYPNNFFSQIAGEYGLIGLGLFVVLYLWFFYKRIRNKSFFLILLLCASGYLMLDYMYEYFNVMVIFELLLFIDIKQQEEKIAEA